MEEITKLLRTQEELARSLVEAIKIISDTQGSQQKQIDLLIGMISQLRKLSELSQSSFIFKNIGIHIGVICGAALTFFFIWLGFKANK